MREVHYRAIHIFVFVILPSDASHDRSNARLPVSLRWRLHRRRVHPSAGPPPRCRLGISQAI
ncbi:hypothetical protein JB92DRAFT_2903535 [Gautieria morchelliformis]|nr:hypothetical protein JB92DRAFT_2903535 [Gautieria morchelliformis]